MEIVTDIDLIEERARAVCASSGCLIGIDGFDGTGKTTLAFELARNLGGIRVGLDSYVTKQDRANNYVGLLRKQHLRRDLSNLLCAFPFVVVDGVCLMSALHLSQHSLSLHVYVKKISPQGLWHDGLHLDNYLAGEPAGSWLDESIYGYHKAEQPHTKASIYYHWVAP